MSTNFYVWHLGTCERIHLGKRSGGWQFTFRGYRRVRPDAVMWDVTDYQSWERLLDLGEIHDEYGTVISADEMREIVRGLSSGRRHDPDVSGWADGSGNFFLDVEFS